MRTLAVRTLSWTLVQGQHPFPRRPKDWREGQERASLGRMRLLGKGPSPCLKPHGEFQTTVFEAEEQNITPIIRIGEGSGSRAGKAGPLFLLQIFMDCLPRNLHCAGAFTHKYEGAMDPAPPHQVMKIHHTRWTEQKIIKIH